ncbi:MAG: hypothetical protein HN368_10800 [Spirochaetales bacterium]|nr:hypothetical protein [Spirochaetales bacterium]
MKRSLDYCLAEYLTETGVMGVGVLNHIINPPDMHEYWCANALFASSLISYAELSGYTEYYDFAVPLVEFIATFDYKNTLWQEWQKAAPQQIIIYTSEGLVKALSAISLLLRRGNTLVSKILRNGRMPWTGCSIGERICGSFRGVWDFINQTATAVLPPMNLRHLRQGRRCLRR